jgi:molybdopterin synthase sulfur carrier subunit
MSVKVQITVPLQLLTNNQCEVECKGRNIVELIENLNKKYPGMKMKICDENGKLKKYIGCFVNGKNIRFLQMENTELKDGDEVSILVPIAGGTI